MATVMPTDLSLEQIFRDLIGVQQNLHQTQLKAESRITAIEGKLDRVESECQQIRDLLLDLSSARGELAVFDERISQRREESGRIIDRLDDIENRLQGLYVRVSLIAGGVAAVPTIITLILTLLRAKGAH